jgi:hypothetical protein
VCIMEIHEDATRSAMIQAVAHNLSTIDRDLDMLRNVAIARNDHDLQNWGNRLQNVVHAAYADALMEFGLSLADLTMDPQGHMPHVHDNHGNERNLSDLIREVTEEAQKDETR